MRATRSCLSKRALALATQPGVGTICGARAAAEVHWRQHRRCCSASTTSRCQSRGTGRVAGVGQPGWQKGRAECTPRLPARAAPRHRRPLCLHSPRRCPNPSPPQPLLPCPTRSQPPLRPHCRHDLGACVLGSRKPLRRARLCSLGENWREQILFQYDAALLCIGNFPFRYEHCLHMPLIKGMQTLGTRYGLPCSALSRAAF